MKTNVILIVLTISCIALVACNRLGYSVSRVESGQEGMVVSAHPLASEIGEQLLKQGGNATDAAIATQFALAVVCPRAGNLGGGGFWVTAPYDDLVRTIDYREEAPGAATRDMYLDEQGNVHPTKPLIGPLAAGIPGTVDGLYTAYTQGSKLKDWKALILPAARIARKGFKITQAEADRLNTYQANFIGSGSPFVKLDMKGTNGGDEPLWKEGDLLVQTTLANTLDSLASVGPSYFYDSPFAERLAKEVRDNGGIWTAQDLSDYQSVWREPIKIEFAGREVYSMPPPSSGGVVLAQMLGMLAPYQLQAEAAKDSVEYYHLLIEAMRRAYEDRAEYLGDPDMVNIPLDSLLDEKYLADKWISFNPDKASISGVSKRKGTKDVYETTHTSVIDAEGNAVSVTTTLNGNYGCKYWSKTGGFFLNNEMDDFSAKPGVPNQFGLVGGEANAIAPGKRMLSSMTPTIVKLNGQIELVLGSPGGSTIITAVMQVFLNEAVLGMSLDEAVKAPRIHHQWLPDEVLYERGRISEAVLKGLEAKGHMLRGVSTLGRVKAVAKTGNTLIGVGDPRNPDDDASGY